MAITVCSGSLAGATSSSTTFTMSLMTGWDQIPGGRRPIPGDVVILEVRKPETDLAAPSGWTALGESTWTDDEGTEHAAHLFWKMIMSREPDPMFHSPSYTGEWEVHGAAFSGYAPIGDGVTGSTAPFPR